jgi:hypothetical protein
MVRKCGLMHRLPGKWRALRRAAAQLNIKPTAVLPHALRATLLISQIYILGIALPRLVLSEILLFRTHALVSAIAQPTPSRGMAGLIDAKCAATLTL